MRDKREQEKDGERGHSRERDADRVILLKRRDMKRDTSKNDEYIR